MYILTSLWVLHTPNTGQNMLFQHLSCKKAEKGIKSKKIRAKFIKIPFFSFNKKACWGPTDQKWHQFTGANWKKCFTKFCLPLFVFLIFRLFCAKRLKKHILTSLWRVQHPNPGRNKQQLCYCRFLFKQTFDWESSS